MECVQAGSKRSLGRNRKRGRDQHNAALVTTAHIHNQKTTAHTQCMSATAAPFGLYTVLTVFVCLLWCLCMSHLSRVHGVD